MVTAPGSIIVASTRPNSTPTAEAEVREAERDQGARERHGHRGEHRDDHGVDQPERERRLLPDLHVVVERERLGDEPVVEDLVRA